MRVLGLVTEAFGGRGGIAEYNRSFLGCLVGHPHCEEAVVLNRVPPREAFSLPGKLHAVSGAEGSKIRFLVKLWQLLRRDRRFDWIFCGHINLLPAAELVRRLTDAPVLLAIHGIDAWQPTGSYLANYLATQVDVCLAVSTYTRERFLEWSGLPEGRCEVMPNAFDPARFTVLPKNPALIERYKLEGKKVLLTMARLASAERYKGIDEVLEIMPSLLRAQPELAYVVAGDGNDRARLERKGAALGLSERVVFSGWVDEAEKADHYRLADAFVMPGRGEGFGIVYLEAMACGIPVVGSKVDGSRDALRDGKLGILVDPDSPSEIEAGILAALDAERGTPEGLEHFSLMNHCKRLRSVFDRMSQGV